MSVMDDRLIDALRTAFIAGWYAYMNQQTESGDSEDVETAWQAFLDQEREAAE